MCVKLLLFIVLSLFARLASAQNLINLGPNQKIQVQGVVQPPNLYTYFGALSGLPATCKVGQLAFITGVPSGQNIYGCILTNVWALQASTGITWPSPVKDQGGQVYNVKAYGAVCNGVTDDTAAIQSVINFFTNGRAATASGSIFFPIGQCLISSPLTYVGSPGEPISFVGAGSGEVTTGSTLVWNGPAGGTMLEMQGANKFLIQDITFDQVN